MEHATRIQRFFRGYLLKYNILSNPLILAWIRGGNPFVGLGDRSLERSWGNRMLRRYLGIKKNTCQWTNILGEYLVRRLLERNGRSVWRPKAIGRHKPDWETDDCIWEVKTRNYSTPGTIGEKILGTPYKYCDIPDNYQKNLRIVVVGYQEIEAVESFGLFCGKNEKRNKMIELWKSIGIEFVRCSDLLKVHQHPITNISYSVSWGFLLFILLLQRIFSFLKPLYFSKFHWCHEFDWTKVIFPELHISASFLCDSSLNPPLW